MPTKPNQKESIHSTSTSDSAQFFNVQPLYTLPHDTVSRRLMFNSSQLPVPPRVRVDQYRRRGDSSPDGAAGGSQRGGSAWRDAFAPRICTA